MIFRKLQRKLREVRHHSRRVERNVFDRAQSIGFVIAAFTAPVAAYTMNEWHRRDRAETILRKHRFQVLTVRAVGSISKLLTCFSPVWKSVGQMLLIKGPRWTEEVEEAESEGLLNRLKLQSITEWPTPGRDGQSVLLQIVKAK